MLLAVNRVSRGAKREIRLCRPLTVLNDALFMEAAKELGYRTATPSNSPDAIVRQLMHKILLREPTADELAELSKYLMDQVTQLSQVPDSLQALGKGIPRPIRATIQMR